MKKRYLYLITIIVFILTMGFIVARYKSKEKNKTASFYPLLDRKGISFQAGEWEQVKNNLMMK